MTRRLGVRAALLLLAAVLAGCGARVPPALVASRPSAADVAAVQRIAGRVADEVTVGLRLIDDTGRLVDALPLPSAVKDKYDCSVLKVLGADAPSPAVTKACGILPAVASSPLAVAREKLKAATTCPSLRSTSAILLGAVDPLVAHLALSDNPSLAFAGTSLRLAFGYARAFLEGGGECSLP